MVEDSQMQFYDYEYFMQESLSLSRLKYKLPNDTMKKFFNIKQKLHIKESSNFKRSYALDNTKLIKQKDEVAKVIVLLNKITTKTYDKLSIDLFECVKSIQSEEYQREICNKVFEIISSNDFYSEMYAKLYTNMINIHETFKTIFDDFLDNYIKKFLQLKYVSPTQDYDEYCSYNKELSKIKSFTTFLNHCLNYNLCDCCTIITLVISFQNKIIEQIDNKDKLSENEALLNNILILFKANIEMFSFHEKWENLLSNNKAIYTTQGAGKNNMMRFKIMDMDDIIKKSSSN